MTKDYKTFKSIDDYGISSYDIKKIVELYNRGYTQQELAKVYKVPKNTIAMIIKKSKK